MTQSEVKKLAKAFATASGHPDPDEYAEAVATAHGGTAAKPKGKKK